MKKCKVKPSKVLMEDTEHKNRHMFDINTNSVFNREAFLWIKVNFCMKGNQLKGLQSSRAISILCSVVVKVKITKKTG